MNLRCYQDRLIQSAYREFTTKQRTLLVAATGTGKTVIFSHVAKDFLQRGRVMVLAHRDELIKQAASKMRDITNVLPTIEKADQWSDEENMHGKPPLVISSIQTQATGRMSRFKSSDFSLVIADECHHSTSDSWSKVLAYYASNPNCKILGVTATPDRADGELLGKIFESVADTYDLHEAVEDGYLVPVVPRMVTIDGLDFSRVHTVAGDLNAGELEEAMLFEEPLHGVAYATIETACGLAQDTLRDLLDAPDRANKLLEKLNGKKPMKCIVFCVSVEHARRMAEIFNRWIPDSADVIHGQLADDDRTKALKKFKDGRTRFLTNCMIATEGFDEPSIEMVVMARPTKSRSLYVQMLGRGTRPAESIASSLGELPDAASRVSCIEQSEKPFVIVMDFVGNSGRHELVTTVDIFGEGYDEDVLARAKEKAAEGMGTVDEHLEKSRDEIEKQKREAELRKKEREERLRAQAMEASRQKLVGAASYRIEESWDNPPKGIDPRHVTVLRKAKVPVEDVANMDRARVGELCRKIVMHWQMGLCSYRQAKTLAKRGWPKEVLETMTFTEASSWIDEIAKSGWKLRYGQTLSTVVSDNANPYV